jgi:hypothetical protein
MKRDEQSILGHGQKLLHHQIHHYGLRTERSIQRGIWRQLRSQQTHPKSPPGGVCSSRELTVIWFRPDRYPVDTLRVIKWVLGICAIHFQIAQFSLTAAEQSKTCPGSKWSFSYICMLWNICYRILIYLTHHAFCTEVNLKLMCPSNLTLLYKLELDKIGCQIQTPPFFRILN